ncbi:MAG: hypothetical protein PVI23_14905, partial [Maricaulaceae bacterium]
MTVGRAQLSQRLAGLAALVCLAACGGAEEGPDLAVILADEPAPRLADYDLFIDAAAREPAPGVAPYDLINLLFSDYAAKHRYVFVPEGESARYDAEGVFDFPVGTVLVKTFAFAPDMRTPEIGERYIETRLLIHKEDGWAAYPYVWNAEETEAVYTPVGSRHEIETITPAGVPVTLNYAIPNRNQCKSCHQSGDDIEPIGPSARNLNHDGPLGINQLADWSERGILSGAPASADAPHVPDAFDESAPLDLRARAWLDVNCAHCHKIDGGASNSGLVLSWTETDSHALGVGKRPTAAGRGSGDSIF